MEWSKDNTHATREMASINNMVMPKEKSASVSNTKMTGVGRLLTISMFTAYKKNKCQKLTDAQKEKRKKRSKQLLRRFAAGRHSKILFTDEKLFTVEQVVNKQNDRVYAVSNPYATRNNANIRSPTNFRSEKETRESYGRRKPYNCDGGHLHKKIAAHGMLPSVARSKVRKKGETSTKHRMEKPHNGTLIVNVFTSGC
ncbi:hypothetical protein OSTOST_00409 [Ostertagia ostertagi]